MDSQIKMQNGLQKAVGPEICKLVEDILEKINQLSDIGKLMLYLKLPTGAVPFHRQAHNSGRFEKESATNLIVLNWIKTHLQENSGTYLPKQDVYESYRLFAERNKFPCISVADFSRLLKAQYPAIRDRRLGKRGSAKYVHSGIQFASSFEPHVTPEIVVPESQILDDSDDEGAAGAVVLEWAHKLFDSNFMTVTQLAEHLISGGYVSSRTAAAFSIIAAAASRTDGSAVSLIPPGGQELTTPASSTHAQLRKNIQEREAYSRLKSKIEKQKQENISADPVNKHVTEKPKSDVEQKNANAVALSAAAAHKIPTRKSTIVQATPPKKILPKAIPVPGSRQDCNPSGGPLPGAVKMIGSAVATAGVPNGYVLLSPNPGHMRPPVFIIPSSVADVPNCSVSGSTNVGTTISLVPQPHVLSQLSGTSAVASVNKPLILSPMISADTIHASTIAESSSSTIRSISFMEPSGAEMAAGTAADNGLTAGPAMLTSGSVTLPGGSANLTVADVTLSSQALTNTLLSFQTVNSEQSASISNGVTSEVLKNVSNMLSSSVSGVTVNGIRLPDANSFNNSPSLCAVSSSTAISERLVTSVSSAAIKSNTTRAGKVATKQKISCAPRTVMSILRENHATDGLADQKSYMKDKRPVARILQEEREKRQKQASTTVDTNSGLQENNFIAWSSLATEKQRLQDSLLNNGNASQCLLLKELLTSKGSVANRRASVDRPTSVTDFGIVTSLSIVSPDLDSDEMGNRMSVSRSSRKRPHTALDDPLSSSGYWMHESFGADRSLSVELIEKSAQDDLLSLDDVLRNFIENQQKDDVQQQGLQPNIDMTNNRAIDSGIDYAAVFSGDIDKSTDPPPAKFVNRSVENLTLQQLQQARDRDLMSRPSFERWQVQPISDIILSSNSSIGRPLSAFGDQIPSMDMNSLRDSRPNTVAAIWEPSSEYRGCTVSIDSCDSACQISAGPRFFTPIHVQSDDLKPAATCDLVKPLAKIAVNLQDTGTSSADCSNDIGHCTFTADIALGPAGVQDSSFVSNAGGKPRAAKRSRIWQRYGDHAGLMDDNQSKMNGTIFSPCFRSETPLSNEVSGIIGDNLIPPIISGETIRMVEDTPSPHRSQSVPVGLLFDLCMPDDISAEFANDSCFDVFDGKSEPSYTDVLDDFHLLQKRPNRKAVADGSRAAVGFWDSLPRGDHMISGVSFHHEQCGTSLPTGARTASIHKRSCNTPPSSQNASPNFDADFRLGQPAACSITSGVIDTPTSLEQGSSVNESLVDELFIDVCSNGTQLSGPSDGQYQW